MPKEKPRYWLCIVGPTDQNKLPPGADLPMRNAVERAFIKLTRSEPEELHTHWGVDEATKADIQSVVYKNYRPE